VTTRPESAAEMFTRANEARDRSMGIGVVDDPYPRYLELRTAGPAHDGTLSGAFGFTGTDGLLFPERPHVTVYSYAEVEAVLKDPETFSSAWYDPQLGPSIGRSILHMDPPEHQRNRQIVQGAFSKQEMAWWESEYVVPTCHHYVDAFVERGRVDLYPEFCVQVPVHVIALALGLPTSDLRWFHGAAVRMTTGGTMPDDSAAATREIEDVLRPLVAERRRRPGRDLISVLVQGRVREPDGEHGLTDDEVLTFCKLLLPAGANTTYRSLGLLLTELFRHPEAMARVRADRSWTDRCVEELVRLEHSTSLVGRLCTRDTELAGRAVAAGTVVLLSLASANHDAGRWDDPDAFDIERAAVPNIAFGWGFHRCLGVHLARMELRAALGVLLDRLPGLRPDPDVAPARITGLMFRAPEHVRAVWDVPSGTRPRG
jgi:cytochrome P450